MASVLGSEFIRERHDILGTAPMHDMPCALNRSGMLVGVVA